MNTTSGELRDGVNNLPTDYTFIGQYSNTDDFGLMYYGARWYDPVLGRFAQADSIIQNPFDPASYDRYAYVRNSPVNFTDPTGHYVPRPVPGCTLYDDDYKCVAGTASALGKSGNPQQPPTWWKPKENDPVTLTTVPGKSGLSGADMYWMYQQYGYDLDKLLTEIMYRELGSWYQNPTSYPLFVEWARRKFLNYAQSQCSAVTFNCFMNWMAAYSQSAAGIFGELKGGKSPQEIAESHKTDNNYDERMEKVAEVVFAMKFSSVAILDPNAPLEVGIDPVTAFSTTPTIGPDSNQILYFDVIPDAYECDKKGVCEWVGPGKGNTDAYDAIYSWNQIHHWFGTRKH